MLQTDGEDMQNREHSCFFSAAHAAKDSGIALKLAKEQGLNLPLASATKKPVSAMITPSSSATRRDTACCSERGRAAPHPRL